MVEQSVLQMTGQPGGWLVYPNAGGGVTQLPNTASVNAGAQLQTGQISLSLLAFGLAGLMLFYVWTRGVQK